MSLTKASGTTYAKKEMFMSMDMGQHVGLYLYSYCRNQKFMFLVLYW